MSSAAELLRHRDTEANQARAWLFRSMTTALTAVLVFAFPPTHALGRHAGWLISSGLLVYAAAVVLRLRLTRGRVSHQEIMTSTFLSVGLVAILQWLAGGYRSPIQLMFALHIFGAAGVLKDRERVAHLALVLLAVLVPIAYGHPSTAQTLAAVVYDVVLLIQAAFLFEYGVRLRAHRYALFEAEREASRRAVTDALTGLGNRRALELELDEAAARAAQGEAVTIVYLDLDGFKAYNDRFGHGAGDALLQRLGAALTDCVQGRGAAFRIGGDEFCVVLDGELESGDPLINRLRIALSEHGSGFRIGPSCGVVVMPRDAEDAQAALRIADERMYTAKRGGRVAAPEVNPVLSRALSEHHLAARHRPVDLSALAWSIAVRLGLPEEDADATARAAQLHDLGKIAIPDGVLSKAGPLDEAEWKLMRQHTVIGEQILATSPAFVEISKLVRSSHERVDGQGYPDGLKGEEIPMGARIVAVCNAYASMLSRRADRAARSSSEALVELRRCAGTQFDAEVVEALAAQIEEVRSHSKPPPTAEDPLAGSKPPPSVAV